MKRLQVPPVIVATILTTAEELDKLSKIDRRYRFGASHATLSSDPSFQLYIVPVLTALVLLRQLHHWPLGRSPPSACRICPSLSAISYADPTGATSVTRSSERAIVNVDMLTALVFAGVRKYIAIVVYYLSEACAQVPAGRRGNESQDLQWSPEIQPFAVLKRRRDSCILGLHYSIEFEALEPYWQLEVRFERSLIWQVSSLLCPWPNSKASIAV
ncbi:hypothetical protein KC354_g132 [Hortaea werneckii]|nr:hypothetical protein KC354_g132 [Hortaea werneckii]